MRGGASSSPSPARAVDPGPVVVSFREAQNGQAFLPRVGVVVMPRRPDVPCARCGRLLFGGRTSLPSGERVCQPCRRARKGAEPDEARPPECGYCLGPFVSKRRGDGRWARACSKSCARRLQLADGSHPFLRLGSVPGPWDYADILTAAEEAVAAAFSDTEQPTENTTTKENTR